MATATAPTPTKVKGTTTRKPRRSKAQVPEYATDLTVASIMAGLFAQHRTNYRTLQAVKGGTGSREARIRLRQTGELLSGFGVSSEDIRLVK